MLGKNTSIARRGLVMRASAAPLVLGKCSVHDENTPRTTCCACFTVLRFVHCKDPSGIVHRMGVFWELDASVFGLRWLLRKLGFSTTWLELHRGKLVCSSKRYDSVRSEGRWVDMGAEFRSVDDPVSCMACLAKDG